MRGRLEAALNAAIKARDLRAAGPLREALAAIDNAGAVAPPDAPARGREPAPVAGSVPGLGAAEAPRRRLTEADLASIVAAEIAERRAAAAEYDRLGRPREAARLRAEADLLAEAAAEPG